MLELQNAGFEVAGTSLLAPLSLTFEPGAVVGLIGPNGSGKSTLMKLLAGLQPPSFGAVRLDGRPVGDWTRRDFARRVAYLAQELPETDELTVAELVRFGRYPWRGLLGRMTPKDEARIVEAMKQTDTFGLADRMVATLSGGERQRVWLAMLLAQESSFLLLDEPLAALDLAHQVEVMDLVRQLSRDLKLGVLVILHDINIASRYCDHIVALRDGRLLRQGPPEELVRQDELREIFGVAMQVLDHPSRQHAVAVVA